MLRKRSLKTLSAKLTLLMTAVVMATVLAMTIQSSSKFSSYILQNIEETSTSMAERTSADVAGILEGWITQMTSATARLASSSLDENANDADLANALKRDNDLLALSLYQIEDGIPKLSRRAFQPAANATGASSLKGRRKSPRAIMAALALEAAASPGTFQDERIIRNVTSEAGSPTVLIAIKYSIGNQTNKFAVLILLASMTKIQVAMPQSRSTIGYIINSTGSIFASTDDRSETDGRAPKNNALVKMAIKRQSPSGFVSEFKDEDQHVKIGSFAQVPGRIPLIVIVERDRDAVFQIITRMYRTAALWGALILLLALMASFVSAGSVTKPLRELVQATKRIAGGDFNIRLTPLTNDEIAELGHSVNNMASRIELLMTAEIEKARFEKELETAKLVQSTFFPKKDIVSTHLSVTGSYQPATECGGDLWGHYHIREGVELVFIADAMGHGAPAALVTAIAYSCCKSLSSILAENSPLDASPGTLLRRLNTIILDAVDGKISMTFFAALFDFKTGIVTFANAGHNFPFVLTGNRNDPRLGSGKKRFPEGSPTAAITLTLMGNPLGVQRDSEYKEKQFAMAAGDKYVLFTDGLIENTLNDQPPFSRKMLIETVSGYGNESIGVIKDNIFTNGYKIFGSENLQDDVTVVVAEVSPLWVKPASLTVENPVPPAAEVAGEPLPVS
jgi:phosphoserine phosphatase RsbU/P